MQVVKLFSFASLITTHGVASQACKPACDSNKTCVTQEDGDWSQCVDCSTSGFYEQCDYWTKEFLPAAEKICVAKCADKPKVTHECKPACDSNKTCVTGEDGYWSQCVDCSASGFFKDCDYWTKEFLPAAEKTCGAKCADKPITPKCMTDKKPGCKDNRTCVTQDDGYWSQCVACDAATFHKECGTWGPDFVKAAKKTCHHKCPKSLEIEKSNCSKPACTGKETCVTQDNGFYSQCVDCTPEVFFRQCAHWEGEFLTAAQKTCGARCTNQPNMSNRCITDNKPGCASDRICLTQDDGDWSQCIKCDATTFHRECGTWGPEFVKAAKRTCHHKCPKSLEIEKSNCSKPACTGKETCVTQDNGFYSQCVDCTPEVFFRQCAHWEGEFLTAAQKTCGARCTNQPNMSNRCITDNKPGCASDRICLTQDDGDWSQCIKCDATTFHRECGTWGPEFVKAAKRTCHHKCPKSLETEISV